MSRVVSRSLFALDRGPSHCLGRVVLYLTFWLASPLLAQDAGKVVFASFRNGDFASSLHSVQLDGKGEERLSLHASGRPGCLDPVVSLDGQRLVFVRGGADGSHLTGLWMMSVDGTNERRLTPDIHRRFGSQAAPAISPDGESIAYVSNLGGSPQVFLTSFAGGKGRPITSGMDHRNPSWSPDGEQVVVSRRLGKASPELWVVKGDGTPGIDLGEVPGDYPSWSPDGRSIVYSVDVGGQFDLFVLDLESRESHRLTSTSDHSERNPSWSPGGYWITYEAKTPDSTDGWQNSIFLIRKDGSDRRRLSGSQFHDFSPTWLRLP